MTTILIHGVETTPEEFWKSLPEAAETFPNGEPADSNFARP